MECVPVVLYNREIKFYGEVNMVANRTAAQVVARSLGVEENEAEMMCGELAWFFRAVAAEQTALSPSTAVDRVWHALLSNSQVYEAFCNESCGVVVRHREGAASEEKYLRALTAIGRLRGELPAAYWPRISGEAVAAKCDGSTDIVPPEMTAAVMAVCDGSTDQQAPPPMAAVVAECDGSTSVVPPPDDGSPDGGAPSPG